MPTSSNVSPAETGTAAAPATLGVLLDTFPTRSETFVVTELRELARLGHRIHIEATRRGDAPFPDLPADVTVAWRADDGPVGLATRLKDLARHPASALRDRWDRRRWARQEQGPRRRELLPVLARLRAANVEHLHAHFAAGAALDALRLSRTLGCSWSVTAHAYDIYQRPENLREKLRAADFATSGCDYTVAELRRVAGADAADRMHRIVMGVDGERFRRTSPLPGGRRVVAVGRLVEKKGFAHLVRAAGLLERAGTPLEQLVIVGDGPLRAALEQLAREELPPGRASFRGALDPDEVRAALQDADVLAMPCVVAADGDRDSMPVVVKEALAMELLVVASDEVGLPEIVVAPAGVLVEPGNDPALADALAGILERPLAQRVQDGRRGREFVLQEADAAAEARRLSSLIAAAVRGRP